MKSPSNLIKKIEKTDPILKSFHLYGLHGLKDIKLDTENSVSILMARNGAGKTTFLSAMNSVLSRRYHKLIDINFDRISFQLAGGEKIEILKSDIENLSSVFKTSKIHEISRDTKSSYDVVFSAIMSLPVESGKWVYSERLFELYRKYSSTDYRKFVDLALVCRKEIYDQVAIIEVVDKEINRAFADAEIVYLPTYRRIEMSLPSKSERYGSSSSRTSNEEFAIPEDVKFGLSDITERLKEISLEIQRTSNSTYKKISANIVNDLLDGSYRLQGNQGDRPDRSALELFFSRIKDAQKSSRFGGIDDEFSVPDLDKIYSDSVDEDTRPFLLYFLSNLNKAIKSTEPLEDRVNGFVDACNEYLMDEDDSAFVNQIGPKDKTFLKKINIEKNDFRPFFTAGGKEKPISIDALSSGEKQVVSLFARMYLYNKRKIVLYDEPELSLSMAWQSKLLPDICKATDFAQLIAITHSPFIFDNDLDQFAQNLNVKLSDNSNEDDSDLDMYNLDKLLSEFESSLSNDKE